MYRMTYSTASIEKASDFSKFKHAILVQSAILTVASIDKEINVVQVDPGSSSNNSNYKGLKKKGS